MGLVLRNLFFPEKQAIIFALKGVIAMAMALTVSLFLNLDRPYWALVSAVFLQMRPETGLVVEKAICQIVGTIVGGLFGILVMTQLMPYPYLGLGVLALWLGINSALSVMVRQANFIYAFAMAGVTAAIIIILVMANPAAASSQAVFNVAQARMSEIIIGSICAGIVSHLFWPMKVKNSLQRQSRSVINQTLSYLVTELDKEGSHEARHQQIDAIMTTLGVVSEDSSAVSYEGPKGPGRSRAANQLCQKVLSLLALIQIFGRLQRRHYELMTPTLTQLIDRLRTAFTQIAESDDFNYCLDQVKILRRELADFRANNDADQPFERHVINIGSEITSDLTVLLRAYRALEERDSRLLNEPRMQSYRDPLAGVITGFRTSVVFLIGATIWVSTGSSAALMIMILPVMFSIMLARIPLVILRVVMKRLLIGVVVAVFVTLFYALNLLSQSSGQLEILLLVLAGPYFVGLLLLADRQTLPYGLGFCIPFSILVSPGRGMARPFSIDYTLSAAMAIFTGVCILFWVFHLIRGPSVQLLVHRIFKATYQDLLDINQQATPVAWYNRRMADRLLRLTNYDQGSKSRAITDLALSALNLGHVSIRLHSICENLAGKHLASLDKWQNALADAFLLATKGKHDDEFNKTSALLYDELVSAVGESTQVEAIKGMFIRLNLTFERSADTIADQNT
ncbi:p-hydroxybenzoic acid efflux pump subunit AaeB [Marinomonas spartinae]|uniref:FUSC family protein n=1 Tax=Marinomonas spartinae TaxID=1792290 RepID=UPI000808F088|nr:FUSC family protein [Marinomonas spartinae]SBS27635.1 p-hydroxybenzoic acid efflux pump subunit AaeB [Marinomonas spartinae]